MLENVPTLFWPSTVPQLPQRASFSLTPGAAIQEYSPDIGMARTSKRSMNAPDSLSCIYLLKNVEQKDTLFQFVKDVAGISFWLPHYEGRKYYILVKSSSGTSKAMEGFSALGGGRWQAQFSFLVWPFAKMDMS